MKNAICTFCGNVCDDIEFDGTVGKNLCPIGEAKFAAKRRMEAPTIEGEKVSYEEAIERAAEILVNAKRPLLYGWASTVNEAIKLGVILAEKLGGIYDQCSSVCHAPSTLAMIEEGIPGGTLGQAKNRADVIVFWGCNPVEAHPRHPSRYSVMARGFLTKGRQYRHIVVVDVRKTATAYLATEFYQIKPGYDFAVFTALRSIVNGHEDAVPDEVGGLSKEKLKELADVLMDGKYGVIFYGLGLTHSRGQDRNVECIVKLVQTLNRQTRYILQPMRGHFNVVGAGAVAAWEAGYEYAIDFSRGYPRFSPSEFTAVEALLRKDCDAALIVASDPAAHFPKKAVERLAEIPVIQIDPHPNVTTLLADIVIPSAIVGIEAEGTVYRMDGIPLRVKKLRETEYWSDYQILRLMLDKVIQMKGE
ncbi:formylmethanofuran dehydrogenase subunit B [Archaeoglobus veneficus]|uniref:formylmethanofuran dehydrogenase subunit B n=1 Tax=Archaeoglobus veneficus (strain DSM 11195 / SNP6) TaxID=693661 RepID=F2KPH5_ARCVS|nr:formylmethanofuran dehydrogenase subunit B [Archaeoglobus veneficus]AEA46406.1 formylmethanofuran dehydrogenase subunit B [Archaeoglobus veneficus SNP6]